MAVAVILLLIIVVTVVILVVVFVLVKRRRSLKEIAEGNVGGNTNTGTNNGMGKVFVLLLPSVKGCGHIIYLVCSQLKYVYA